jgi:hypothetical protein
MERAGLFGSGVYSVHAIFGSEVNAIVGTDMFGFQ